jgi:hypothetical protein
MYAPASAGTNFAVVRSTSLALDDVKRMTPPTSAPTTAMAMAMMMPESRRGTVDMVTTPRGAASAEPLLGLIIGQAVGVT